MNFLHGYPMHMGMLSRSASIPALGDYEMDYAAKNPQYRQDYIKRYNAENIAYVNELRKLSPQDALITFAWSSYPNVLASKNLNREQQALKNLLLQQRAGTVDQAYNLFVQHKKDYSFGDKRLFGTFPSDKAYFTKVFNHTKNVFQKLKPLVNNPNAFWAEMSKAVPSLRFHVYDDTTHPLYCNIEDKNISNNITVRSLGEIAGALAVLESLVPTQGAQAYADAVKQERDAQTQAIVAAQRAQKAQQVQQAQQTQQIQQVQQAQQTPLQSQEESTPQQGAGTATEESSNVGLMVGVGVGVLALLGTIGYIVVKKREKSKLKN